MKRTVTLLLSLLMLLSLAAGCSNNGGSQTSDPAPATDAGTTAATTPATEAPTQPAKEKVLVVRTGADPLSLEPNCSADDAAYTVVSNIYSQLVRIDTNLNMIPDLATEWWTSEDGLTLTFKLVENATFHDGHPVTAEDAAYTFTYIIENDHTLYHNRFASNIESVEAPDDYTVVFNLKNPYSALVGYLGYYATFVLPKHVFDNGQPWKENPAAMNPVGSGPFKFVEHKPGESITLEKFDDYFKTDVKLDRLIFRQIPDAATAVQALLGGEIDYMGSIPSANIDQLLADPNFTMTRSARPSPSYISFNFAKEDILTLPVHQAIAHCINREDISKKIFNGVRQPETTFYPSVVEWASNPNAPVPEFSIEKAVQILEEAGYAKDADGYYIRGLILDTFSSDSHPDVAKLIQGTCKEAGIELEIIVSEPQGWNQKVGRDRDFMLNMQGGFQGPDVSALSARIGAGMGSNFGNYVNEEIEQLFVDGMKSSDEKVRAPIYHRIQEIMAAELPLVPIL